MLLSATNDAVNFVAKIISSFPFYTGNFWA
jgi:hypothetical protein